MADASQKGDEVQYSVGIDDLLICMKTTRETSTAAPTYDTKIWRIPNVKKIGVKGNGKTQELWASNKLFAKVIQETQHVLTISHIGLPTNLMDQMTGASITKGTSFGTTDAHEYPEFALGILAPKSDNVMDAIWYPSCTIDAATQEDYETQEEAFKENDYSIEIDANGLRNNKILFSKFSNARTQTDGMDVDTFIKQPIYDPTQIASIAVTKPVE